jgi:hypothetical protein
MATISKRDVINLYKEITHKDVTESYMNYHPNGRKTIKLKVHHLTPEQLTTMSNALREKYPNFHRIKNTYENRKMIEQADCRVFHEEQLEKVVISFHAPV